MGEFNRVLAAVFTAAAVINGLAALTGAGAGPWQAYGASSVGCWALARTFRLERILEDGRDSS